MAIGFRHLGCRWFALLLSLALLVAGCRPSGDSDLAASPPMPSAAVEAQAIDNLLRLYSEALQQEDIDRLQTLLAPGGSIYVANFAQGALKSVLSLVGGATTPPIGRIARPP
jgi:hypothetical protein